MARIADIEGIGPRYAKKLSKLGIRSTEALLLRGASDRGRKLLAERTGISRKLILTWVNHADLFRIKGVGGEYAELLEAAGVDTVRELAQRRPENLRAQLASTNHQSSLVRRLPGARQVRSWVSQAKSLPRIVAY